jgi:hypothetical protein
LADPQLLELQTLFLRAARVVAAVWLGCERYDFRSPMNCRQRILAVRTARDAAFASKDYRAAGEPRWG